MSLFTHGGAFSLLIQEIRGSGDTGVAVMAASRLLTSIMLLLSAPVRWTLHLWPAAFYFGLVVPSLVAGGCPRLRQVARFPPLITAWVLVPDSLSSWSFLIFDGTGRCLAGPSCSFSCGNYDLRLRLPSAQSFLISMFCCRSCFLLLRLLASACQDLIGFLGLCTPSFSGLASLGSHVMKHGFGTGES
jgi:hypothetical protein